MDYIYSLMDIDSLEFFLPSDEEEQSDEANHHEETNEPFLVWPSYSLF